MILCNISDPVVEEWVGKALNGGDDISVEPIRKACCDERGADLILQNELEQRKFSSVINNMTHKRIISAFIAKPPIRQKRMAKVQDKKLQRLDVR